MRVSLKAVGLGLALAAAGGMFALRTTQAQAGPPSASGYYAGKVAFKDYSTEGGKASHGAFDATMNINQAGTDVYIDLNVAAEGGNQQFFLQGGIGNGNLWATNGNAASPLVISGHISGSSGKLQVKGTGVFVDSPDINELKISFRQAVVAR